MAELLTERIRRNARELKLLALAESADELVERAEEAKLGYREFLDLVLEEEVGVLEGRRYASRVKLSALPHHKTLADFDLAFQPELDTKTITSSAPCTSTAGPPSARSSRPRCARSSTPTAGRRHASASPS